MWDRILAKKDALDRLRPLTERSLAALAAWYDVELTYTSNAIEGNTLTRSETAIVIEKGLTIGGKPLKDHLEAMATRLRSTTSADWRRGASRFGRETHARSICSCLDAPTPRRPAATAGTSAPSPVRR
jgi:hypothetical protein